MMAAMVFAGSQVQAQQEIECQNSSSCIVEVYVNYYPSGPCNGTLTAHGITISANSTSTITLPSGAVLSDFQVAYESPGGSTSVIKVWDCKTHVPSGTENLDSCTQQTSVDWHQPNGTSTTGDYFLDINP